MAVVASPQPDEDLPLSIEPLLGWRAWRLVRRGGRLRLGSLARPDTWSAQLAERAVCAAYRPGGHTAPQENCSCGYYATDSWGSLCAAHVFSDGVGVIGAVGQWGTVVEHGAGARSEYAYPVRLRFVCGPCLVLKVVRDPVLVVDFGDGQLSPRCRRHTRGAPGVPVAAVESELLDEYAVELLPKPEISWGQRLGWRGKGMPSAAQAGIYAVSAVFMLIRIVIGIMFTLWMIGLAFMVAAVVIGALVNVFDTVVHGRDPSPVARAAPSVESSSPDVRFVRHRYARVEPHRGVPPPPRLAAPCGVGHGDYVEFVECFGPRVDLLGIAQQTDPAGTAKDCFGQTDAYSSGPHWHVCWIALPGAWVDPFPSSPNPFVHPLGGAFDGDR